MCLSGSGVGVGVSHKAKSRSSLERRQNASCGVSDWRVWHEHSISVAKKLFWQSRSGVRVKLGQGSYLCDKIHKWLSGYVVCGIKLNDLTQVLFLSYRISIWVLAGRGSWQRKVRRSFLHIQGDGSVSVEPFLGVSCVVLGSGFCILFNVFVQSGSDFYQMRRMIRKKEQKVILAKISFFDIKVSV